MFEFTSYVLPFIVSTVILLYISLYSYRLRDKVEIAGLFSLQTIAMAVWTACYAMELSSPTLEGKVLWAKMKYFGATSGPVLWLIFSLHYTNNKHWLTLPLSLFLWGFSVITIVVVFTNDIHHWYWVSIALLPGFPETQSEQGFFFWIYAVFIYSLILASVIIYANYYRKVPVYFRRQSILMVIGTFVPLGIRILEDFIGWDPFPKIDNVILFLLLSAILYAVALFRYSALEILPIAHDVIVRNINSGILVLNTKGHVVEINPYATIWIDSKHDSVIGKPLSAVLHEWPDLQYSPQLTSQVEREVSLTRGDGTSYFLVQISPIRDKRAIVIGHVIVFMDITDRKFAEMELERLARTDVLTGVTNRRHFFELAENEYQRFQRYKHPIAIILLDIDHFKKINDTYGHLAGDYVLKIFAGECRKQLRGSDIFARYGGEEFIALLVETSQEMAIETAERIRKTIENLAIEFEGKKIPVTTSVGITFSNENINLGLEKMIDMADKALYQSKQNGRNQVTLWSGD